eukprot:TRINITY_DN958_c0_g1_i2.p1 TRINITY_DN958_c0_g1~~TRINITY_DN958_c0_g1_i2.p1  ORF type:complete len:235 (-),score=66.01 TRINITY_DN958_c0_g1_i2:197-901(-)
MKNGEGNNYSDTIMAHIKEFLIKRGLVSSQMGGHLSLQELQLHLGFLLRNFPCPDLVVGNSMRELMDVFLLFIAKCHLQDLNYQRSISMALPQMSPSPSFGDGLSSISNFPILSSDRLLPYPMNNPIPFLRIPRSPSTGSSSDFEGFALSRSEEDSPRSPSPLLPSVASMVISSPHNPSSSSRVAPQKSLSLESILSSSNRPNLPFPYNFSSQMQVHHGGSSSQYFGSQNTTNR